MLTVQPFAFNPLQENTYVLYNDKGDCGIIDPGCYFASEQQALTSFIEEAGLKPVLLLNTHCHLDHIFGNNFVRQTYGLTLHLHPQEKAVLAYGPATAGLWGLTLDEYEGGLTFIDEGQTVTIGDDALRILLTPGHSPGSLSFYSEAAKFVISGDVLFDGGVGRTDLPGGNFQILEESIRTKLYTLPADTVVHPGHGGSTTVGDEINSNPFVRIE